MIGIGRKQMIVGVLVLPLWKTMMVMIDLATAAQTAATTATAAAVVEMTINCPSSTKTKTQKKDKAMTTTMTTTMTRILHLINKMIEEGTTFTSDYPVVIRNVITRQ